MNESGFRCSNCLPIWEGRAEACPRDGWCRAFGVSAALFPTKGASLMETASLTGELRSNGSWLEVVVWAKTGDAVPKG